MIAYSGPAKISVQRALGGESNRPHLRGLGKSTTAVRSYFVYDELRLQTMELFRNRVDVHPAAS